MAPSIQPHSVPLPCGPEAAQLWESIRRAMTQVGAVDGLREAVRLLVELEHSPFPRASRLAEDALELASLDRHRGSKTVARNLVLRLRGYAHLARSAEEGRRGRYVRDRQASKLHLEAILADELLMPKVADLMEAGEPMKVIQKKLGISKERANRIKVMARERQAYPARFRRT